jgi:PAS domain S-box-containing protein
MEDPGGGDEAERERLLVQMRAANEHLVLATLEAEEVASAARRERDRATDRETRLRAITETAATVLWSAQPDGAMTADAASWERFTGTPLDPADPLWGWLAAVHPEDRAAVRDTWARSVATARPYICEHRFQTPAGERWVVSRAVPILIAGRVREWSGVTTDVTERSHREKATEQFIGILGHDLRNPLAAISLGAEVFRDLPEPYARVARQILRSTRRMEVMIRDILDLTRGRLGGGIPVALERCDLGALALEITDEMRLAHPRRDIECEVSGDLAGICDQGRAQQAISNLLGNAVAHGLDPVRLAVRGVGDEIRISVRNAGKPIPREILPRLFEPFSRGYASDDRGAPKGLGLGLYIVHEIVVAHGGTIVVTSSEDGGTEFVVTWPRDGRARSVSAT